ncbi:MAG TPA: hypothetical protein VFR24_26625 [Candidatus Angelobacter sp.]|nr:hypothetical protein [Candidatus Angelobacter sp.]
MQRKSGLGCLMQIVLVLVVCGVLMMAVTALLTPWAFYMGGRFHLLPYWQGWGRLHSNSAGGDYAVYIYIYPKTGRGLGTTHLTGNALLCTPRGEKFSLRLGGDFQKGTRRDTNGRTASFYMSPYTLKSQFTSQYQRPELELRGRWSNPDLVLDDHGSIARNFTSDAQVRTSLNGVPYMKEVSPVTLHEGSKSEFEAACSAVKSK